MVELKENVTITTKTPIKPSKEKIINLALKFHSQGNILEAVKNYQYFINQGFKDHRVFSNYGVILKDLGKLPEAELLIRKAIELNPNFAEPYNNLGIILKDIGNLKEAELLIRKAIELKPDFANAYYNLGNILIDSGNLKGAELSTRKAIALNPNFAEAYFNLGNILKRYGNIEQAQISYSQAIALKPDFTKALMNRWQLLFDKKEFDLALKDADSCNTGMSRACALETLYALGKIKDIYERIEETSELDDENIRVASFAAFISEQEKIDCSHNFCRDPLSLIHFSNLNHHLEGHDNFIKEIVNELRSFKTTWEPQGKTTKNGFQTPFGINLFDNSSKRVSQLKSIILEELDTYYLKFKQESCSYIQKWPSDKKLTGWHVILKKQGYQDAHIHPSGWLSGVIYLKVVPPLDKDEGAIEFSLNGSNYSNCNSPQLTFQPKLGDMVFFPSSLHHRTIPFTTDTDRIVVAFDLIPSIIKSSSFYDV